MKCLLFRLLENADTDEAASAQGEDEENQDKRTNRLNITPPHVKITPEKTGLIDDIAVPTLEKPGTKWPERGSRWVREEEEIALEYLKTNEETNAYLALVERRGISAFVSKLTTLKRAMKRRQPKDVSGGEKDTSSLGMLGSTDKQTRWKIQEEEILEAHIITGIESEAYLTLRATGGVRSFDAKYKRIKHKMRHQDTPEPREYTQRRIKVKEIHQTSSPRKYTTIICLWPGCYAKFEDDETMKRHVFDIHENLTRLCPDEQCMMSYPRMEELRDHLELRHPGIELESVPEGNDNRYLQETELSPDWVGKRREVDSLRTDCCDILISDVYKAAYENASLRKWLRDKGLTNQSGLDEGYHQSIYTANEPSKGVVRRKCKRYCNEEHHFAINKSIFYWTLLIHQEPNSQDLDKFISDTLLGCEISHRCHWARCLAVSDLELVLQSTNQDRTICKNRGREHIGKCQAEGSKHKWLAPCYEANRPIGPLFTRTVEKRMT